jgi:hypothetical protein
MIVSKRARANSSHSPYIILCVLIAAHVGLPAELYDVYARRMGAGSAAPQHPLQNRDLNTLTYVASRLKLVDGLHNQHDRDALEHHVVWC